MYFFNIVYYNIIYFMYIKHRSQSQYDVPMSIFLNTNNKYELK